jgi:hypothetical protein
MSLINSSYFIGSINIPNSNALHIEEAIQAIIMEREEEMLIKFFGYELFNLFKLGLQQSTIESKWLDLLYGKSFVSSKCGKVVNWCGLVSKLAPLPTVVNESGNFFFQVGAVGGPSNGSEIYENVNLKGRKYTVFQRGFGPLWEGVDIINLNSGGFSFLNNILFSSDDIYYIQFNDIGVTIPVLQTVGNSIINDYYFTVGSVLQTETGALAPIDGDTIFNDPFLLNKKYRVIQRGFGILHFGVDIELLTSGGFSILNGNVFSGNDVYDIQLLDTSIFSSNNIRFPLSPISDYIYYWYSRNIHTQTAMGEVQTKNENAINSYPNYKEKMAYNRFVDKMTVLDDFLYVNRDLYPEYQRHCCERRNLLVKINGLNI